MVSLSHKEKRIQFTLVFFSIVHSGFSLVAWISSISYARIHVTHSFLLEIVFFFLSIFSDNSIWRNFFMNHVRNAVFIVLWLSRSSIGFEMNSHNYETKRNEKISSQIDFTVLGRKMILSLVSGHTHHVHLLFFFFALFLPLARAIKWKYWNCHTRTTFFWHFHHRYTYMRQRNFFRKK